MNEETYRLKDEATILTPALICYPDIINRNIARMIHRAGTADALWVHVKSYKTPEIVRMLMKAGVKRLKCATIAEAEMVATCGAEYILLAYPLVGPDIRRFITLMAVYASTVFYAIGDNQGMLEELSRMACEERARVKVLMDVNNGLNRTGVSVQRLEAAYEAASSLPGLEVCGLHVYDGHRHETDAQQRQRRVDEDMAGVYAVRSSLLRKGFRCDTLVLGGTPSFPCHAGQKGVFLSPGTCVLQDAGYAKTYPDLPFEAAAVVLTRVVSHPADDLFTMDMGYKAVAADPAIPRAMLLGYEQAQTVMQNEEHWTLRMPDSQFAQRPAIGQELYAVPWHICPTVALYGEMLVAQNGCIAGTWPIVARDRKIHL